MKYSYKFTQSKEIKTFKINKEYPFFKIVNIKVPPDPENVISDISKISLTFRKSKYNGSSTEGQVFIGLHVLDYKNNTPFIDINGIINNQYEYYYDTLELIYENESGKEDQIEIFYECHYLDVSFQEALQNFDHHLSENDNAKILFSAPYGHGKTTFLKQYFETKENEYEVFYLFPVNYSVSQNEDIFQYIKCEILFQLIERDVEFDKEKFTYLKTLPHFILKNPDKLLSPFLLLLPKIGKSALDLYDKFNNLAKEYFDYHDGQQSDDKKDIESYIESFYMREGSIYEDNFYTQLIRQLLEQLKVKNKKENVLVIDDTDRMDPEHIFRILNVFAAHFDSYEYHQNTNKFGFDKIIIVGDYLNLKKIFRHKYGPSTDFSGYIDKFFSKSIYDYVNVEAILTSIISKLEPQRLGLLQVLLEDLLKTKNLSLREILKLRKIVLEEVQNNNIKINVAAKEMLFELHILAKIFDVESIINKLENCKNNIDIMLNYNSPNYDVLSALCIPTLFLQDLQTEPDKSVILNLNDNKLNIFFKQQNYNRYIAVPNNNENSFTFSAKDFYDIIIQITRKFGRKLVTLDF